MITERSMSRGDFNYALERALDGWIVSDTGAGDELQAALDEIAEMGGEAADEQVEKARALFAEQQAAHKA